MKKYIYGVDVGGTNIKIGLFSISSKKMIFKTEIETPKNNQQESILTAIVDKLKTINSSQGISMDDVNGLGVTVPCPIKDGFVSNCANIDMCNINLIDELNDLLPKHIIIKVGNDATLAAVGENNSLKKPYENAVLITLGTGVGGGIIINSKIIEGKSGFGGEIGHIKVFDTNKTCGCGKKGCLEQICGSNAIIEYTKELLLKEKSELLGINFTVKDIFDAAKKDDRVALETTNRVAKYLALAMANIAVTIEPEVFIIGGGVSKAGDFLLNLIKKQYREIARFSTGDIPIILATTGNDAGMIGAFYLTLNSLKK